MTIILGGFEKDFIYMAGDRSAVGGDGSITSRRRSKVFSLPVRIANTERTEDMLLGYTDSFRMGDLLRFFDPVAPYQMDPYQYLVRYFVNGLREQFKAAGFNRQQSEGEEATGQILVAFRGSLFTIESDFQIAEDYGNFTAIGSASDFALGMAEGLLRTELPITTVMLDALDFAQRRHAYVRKPFDLYRISSESGKAEFVTGRYEPNRNY